MRRSRASDSKLIANASSSVHNTEQNEESEVHILSCKSRHLCNDKQIIDMIIDYFKVLGTQMTDR